MKNTPNHTEFNDLPPKLKEKISNIYDTEKITREDFCGIVDSMDDYDSSELKNYYFIISEADFLPKEVQSFCIDMMLYLEQKDDDGFYASFDYFKEFEKIAPLI
jgi:hypothetical protein